MNDKFKALSNSKWRTKWKIWKKSDLEYDEAAVKKFQLKGLIVYPCFGGFFPLYIYSTNDGSRRSLN